MTFDPRICISPCTVKNNYSIWSKKEDRSLKKSKILLEMEWNFLKITQLWVNYTPFRVRFYSFLQSDPLFTPYRVIIFYSVAASFCTVTFFHILLVLVFHSSHLPRFVIFLLEVQDPRDDYDSIIDKTVGTFTDPHGGGSCMCIPIFVTVSV